MAVRYITVTPITNLFQPATRAFGDVAIVGDCNAAATGPKKIPIAITNPLSVSNPANPGGANLPVDDPKWFQGDLAEAVKKALAQSPGPTTIWAVRIDTADGANAISNALDIVGKLNVQIVVLANMPLKDAATGKAQIELLASHVNTVSNTGGDGKERIGVAMLGKGVTDPSIISANMSINRMVMVAHKSSEDAAAAVAGVIGGQQPYNSLLLKQVVIDMNDVFSDSEIDAFNTAHVNWLTDPVLIPGRGFYMGEGYTLGASQPYIDIVRVIDDISFKLKANLISSIGVLRIGRSGLRAVASEISAVLEPYLQANIINSYTVFIPLLVLLDKPPASLSDVELQEIHNAQVTRTVEAVVSVEYAGAIHRLNITLKFE
jgi:hypothetical protein